MLHISTCLIQHVKRTCCVNLCAALIQQDWAAIHWFRSWWYLRGISSLGRHIWQMQNLYLRHHVWFHGSYAQTFLHPIVCQEYKTPWHVLFDVNLDTSGRGVQSRLTIGCRKITHIYLCHQHIEFRVCSVAVQLVQKPFSAVKGFSMVQWSPRFLLTSVNHSKPSSMSTATTLTIHIIGTPKTISPEVSGCSACR